MKDLIDRVANALGQSGVTVDQIHDKLIGEGMSEYDAFLTYIAGKMLYLSRKNRYVHPGPMSAVTVPHMKKVKL